MSEYDEMSVRNTEQSIHTRVSEVLRYTCQYVRAINWNTANGRNLVSTTNGDVGRGTDVPENSL